MDVEAYLVYGKKGELRFLAGLNVTNQVAAHCEILLRSVLRLSAAVTGLSTIMKRLVSSANRRMFEPMSLTMSLMYTQKSKGPKIEPCGTPARMKVHSETVLGRTTRCFLSER